jgi:hypothetical protein
VAASAGNVLSVPPGETIIRRLRAWTLESQMQIQTLAGKHKASHFSAQSLILLSVK